MQRMDRSPGHTLARAAAALATLAAGALVAVVATGGTARSAAPPPPLATKTHLGAAPRDHVVLSMAGTTAPRRFRRVLRSGTLEANPFVVPRKSALHVTDVEFVGGWNQPGRGPAQRVLRLELVNDADIVKRGTVAYVSALPSSAPDLGTTIFYSGARTMTTGIVVGFGSHLEADAPETLAPLHGDPVVQPFHGDVVVRGYLVKDP